MHDCGATVSSSVVCELPWLVHVGNSSSVKASDSRSTSYPPTGFASVLEARVHTWPPDIPAATRTAGIGRCRTFVPDVRTAPTIHDARAAGSAVATRAASVRGASCANARNESQNSHDQDHFHIAVLPGYAGSNAWQKLDIPRPAQPYSFRDLRCSQDGVHGRFGSRPAISFAGSKMK